MNVIQPEPFYLRHLGDGERGHSLVIPIGRGRALRLGFQFRSWLRIGPVAYKVIATKQFINKMAEITNEPESKVIDDLQARGIEIEK